MRKLGRIQRERKIKDRRTEKGRAEQVTVLTRLAVTHSKSSSTSAMYPKGSHTYTYIYVYDNS